MATSKGHSFHLLPDEEMLEDLREYDIVTSDSFFKRKIPNPSEVFELFRDIFLKTEIQQSDVKDFPDNVEKDPTMPELQKVVVVGEIETLCEVCQVDFKLTHVIFPSFERVRIILSAVINLI